MRVHKSVRNQRDNQEFPIQPYQQREIATQGINHLFCVFLLNNLSLTQCNHWQSVGTKVKVTILQACLQMQIPPDVRITIQGNIRQGNETVSTTPITEITGNEKTIKRNSM